MPPRRKIEESGIYAVDIAILTDSKDIVNLNKYGIFFCTGGEINIVLGDNEYRICSKNVIICPPLVTLRIDSFTADIKGFIGIVDFEFILSTLSRLTDASSQLYTLSNPFLTLDDATYAHLEELCNLAIDCFDSYQAENARSAAEGSRHAGKAAILHETVGGIWQIICHIILLAYIDAYPVRPNHIERGDMIFARFILSLGRNVSTCREVCFYAAEQNLTPRYFATLIRERSGRTPLEWITTAAVIVAKRLLHDPEIPVAEIADVMQFTDASAFTAWFRHNTGLTPSAYRRAGQQAADDFRTVDNHP